MLQKEKKSFIFLILWHLTDIWKILNFAKIQQLSRRDHIVSLRL